MVLDTRRRQFLTRVTFTIGGTAMASVLPASLLQAAMPAACLVDAAAWPDPCGDWQLDDICSSYPPYSMHFTPAVPATASMDAVVEPVDQHWIG